MCLRAEQVAAQAQGEAGAPGPSLLRGVTSTNGAPVVRWCLHALVLACLLVACWLLANAFALVLLPHVLSSRQLQRWCPNKPLAPFVIAGEVYEGL
jgi:hypothetical protein